MDMKTKYPIGILGATGMVGQRYIQLLENHPWFEITWVGASERSAGKLYSEATNWRLEGSMPDSVASMTVSDCVPGNGAPELVFSAMDAGVATEIERAFAEAGHTVVSNSKNHRMELDVPLLVPEINADHLRLLKAQTGSLAHTSSLVAVFYPSLLGMVFSFIAGLVALKWLSHWLEGGYWHVFGYYCLAASSVVLCLHLALGL